MNRKLDFVGDFMLPDDYEQQRMREIYANIDKEEYRKLCMSGMGLFFMAIDTRRKEGELEKITGVIIDNLGLIESTFEGELNSEVIRFTKRYPKELIDKGYSVDEIPYEGRKYRDGTFKGSYKMKVGLGNPTVWEGQFTLKKYFNPELN